MFPALGQAEKTNLKQRPGIALRNSEPLAPGFVIEVRGICHISWFKDQKVSEFCVKLLHVSFNRSQLNDKTCSNSK